MEEITRIPRKEITRIPRKEKKRLKKWLGNNVLPKKSQLLLIFYPMFRDRVVFPKKGKMLREPLVHLLPKLRIDTMLLSENKITIKSEYGISSISLRLIKGTVTYMGNYSFKGVASTPQILHSNINLNSNRPIDGLEIDATDGEVEITIIGQIV